MAEDKVTLIEANPSRRSRRRRRSRNPRPARIAGQALAVPTSREIGGVVLGTTGGVVVTGFANRLLGNVGSGTLNSVLVIGAAALTNFFIGAFVGKTIGGRLDRGKELSNSYVLGAAAVHALQLIGTFGVTNVFGVSVPQINGVAAPRGGGRPALNPGRPAGGMSPAMRPTRSLTPGVSGAPAGGNRQSVGLSEQDGEMMWQIV